MADSFTPQQIEQFMQEFFTTVGRRQYVGARYVPIFGRIGEESIAWDNSAPYEPLTVVTYEGNSYTSRTYVPAGIDITNTTYWALTGNYWAQIEQYRQEVAQYNGRITDLEDALPITNFTELNTVKEYVDDLGAVIPSTDFDDTNTVKKYVDDLGAIIPSTDFDDTNTVKKYVDDNISNTIKNLGEKDSCEIMRLGRLLTYSGNGNFGQCTFKNGSYWYAAGQDTLGKFSDSGVMISHITDTRIGHANGGCIVDDNIYLASGTAVLTVAEYDTYSLNFRNLYTFTRFSILGMDCVDDVFYGYGYDTSSVYTKPVIYTMDLSNSTQEFVCEFDSMYEKYTAAFQDMCIYDGYAYVAYTDPNIIQKINLETGATIKIYNLPNGDGVNPTCELESLYVENGMMYVTTGWYPFGSTSLNNSGLYKSIVQIFQTNILGAIDISRNGYADFGFNYLNVDGNGTPIFDPSPRSGYTTVAEACIYANYHHGGYLMINNIGATEKEVVYLYDGSYTIYGLNRDNVNIYIVDVRSSKVNFANFKVTCNNASVFGVGLNGCNGILSNIDFTTARHYIELCKLTYNNFNFSQTPEIQLLDSDIKFASPSTTINTSINALTTTPNYNNTHVVYEGSCETGVMHLMHKLVRIAIATGGTGAVPSFSALLTREAMSEFPTTAIERGTNNATFTKLRFNTNGSIDIYNSGAGTWDALNTAHRMLIEGF